MVTSSIIDTPFNVGTRAAALHDLGIRTIARYYNFRNSDRLPEKALGLAEARALARAGIRLVTVFQQRQTRVEDFAEHIGLRAGRRAHALAADAVGQPEGSAIYFAVDFDASEQDIDKSIRPYFEGVRQALAAEGGGTPRYRVGAYGSGLVCRHLSEARLIDFVWISMSRGFRGTRELLESGGWHLNQLAPARSLLGFGVDFNESNPALPDFGSFTVEEQEAHADLVARYQEARVPGVVRHVTARAGLRLRAGPGTRFDVLDLLPAGTPVHVAEVADGWAKIDREGDGCIDGFVFAAFLR